MFIKLLAKIIIIDIIFISIKMKNIDLYIKFLNDLFDKTIIEIRYLPLIERLDESQKEGLVKKIKESFSKFEERNKEYAQFIRDYY